MVEGDYSKDMESLVEKGSPEISDCMVAGAGPAGLAAALALAQAGASVTMVGETPQEDGLDGRTAALFNSSIGLLRTLVVWPEVEAHCAPLLAIRIVDCTGGLLRAPEVVFRAGDVGLEQFGWNVPNRALTQALWAAAVRMERLRVVEGRVATACAEGDSWRLGLDRGETVAGRLVVAADGRNSLFRKAAGIATKSWAYDQAAVVTSFEHSRAHHGVSTEFQGRDGPCTTVPLPGLASSLVWVRRRVEAERLAALDDDGFRRALDGQLAGLLGRIGELAPRRCFALSGLAAESMGQRRVALVGEAGHVMAPIGAQGLNLGLRDAGWIGECVGDEMQRGGDAGSERVLGAYRAARAQDVDMRVAAVDALNRSLLTDLLPVALARGLGLHLLGLVPGLKRAVIREGLAASGPLPRAMR